MEDIIYNQQYARFGKVAFIILNRIDKLNALTEEMLDSIAKHLYAYERDANIKIIVITSKCPKAFCAGGDLKEIFSLRYDINRLINFFSNEYKLNKYISTYPKPIISLLNGYTMGGGVGLGMHVKYPIALSDFVFAMPENKIGLFPDVGGKYILHKMPGRLGLFYALTGREVELPDAINFGIIKYALMHETADNFLEQLMDLADLENLDNFLEKNSLVIPKDNVSIDPKINKHFNFATVQEIFASLKLDNSKWARQVYSELSMCSPTSLLVTMQAMIWVENQDLSECLATDFMLVSRILAGNDFFEGIRAKIIDKDNAPVWGSSNFTSQFS